MAVPIRIDISYLK